MNLRALTLASISRQQPSLIRYVHPREWPEDEPVRQQVIREFGFVPAPLLIQSCVQKLFAGSWMILRETSLAGVVPRSVKETLSLVVSRRNHCPFCEESHAMVLFGLRLPRIVLDISAGNLDRLDDPHLARIVEWASEAKPVQPKGPSQDVPFSPEQAPELIGTLVLFHYLNRVVNVFLTESPLPGPGWLPGWKRLWQRMGGRVFRDFFNTSLAPGKSLQFLPESALASDLQWAGANSHVAGAFARFDHVLGQAAETMLSGDSRKIVEERLSRWNGESPSLDQGWIGEAIAPLPTEDKPLARLALLAAFAPYRVSPREIEDARVHGSDDADLVITVAWAAFSAARRVGSWMT